MRGPRQTETLRTSPSTSKSKEYECILVIVSHHLTLCVQGTGTAVMLLSQGTDGNCNPYRTSTVYISLTSDLALSKRGYWLTQPVQYILENSAVSTLHPLRILLR